MNNKGFTLVELLAAVTIMLMITIIAVPTSMKFIEKGKQEQYHILENQILGAANKYYIKHKNTKCIELSKLINDIDEKYIENDYIKDPRNNQPLNSKVEVIVDNSKVSYNLVTTCN